MAAVIAVERIGALLDEAAGYGCSVAWLDAGGLKLGSHVGNARFEIDFVGERLTEVGRGRGVSGRRDRGPGPGAGSPSPPIASAGPGNVLDATLAEFAGRHMGHVSCVLQGRIVGAGSWKALLLSALQLIERVQPGTLERVASEKGRTKRAVARQPDLLYADPKLAKFATQIEGGWWVATNNNRHEVEKVIRRAAFHAGLDVEIAGSARRGGAVDR